MKMYLEFMQLIKDYFVTLKLKEFLYEWILPIILSCLFYFYSKISIQEMSDFIPILINVLAILVGFSIASVTILSTNSSNNIKNLKKVLSERKIGNKKINLYQLILITFSFILLVEIFLLIFNLILKFFVMSDYFKLLYTINIFFIIHILLLNLRNITNIYFIFFRRSEGSD